MRFAIPTDQVPNGSKEIDYLTVHVDSSGTYISPSDAIMSPASKKLSSFKQRQINKQ